MVGGCALRICLENPDIGQMTVIGRRPTGVNHARLHIFRPGYIYPVTPRKEPNLVYRISRFLYPLLRHVYPNIGIASEDLARAMVRAGLYGAGKSENPILENKNIRFMEGL